MKLLFNALTTVKTPLNKRQTLRALLESQKIRNKISDTAFVELVQVQRLTKSSTPYAAQGLACV